MAVADSPEDESWEGFGILAVVRTRDAIEAHLTVVFTALAVSREAQARTGLAIGNIVRQLRALRSATIAINGTTQAFAPVIGPDQQPILDALNATRPTHQPIEPTQVGR